MDTQNKSGFNLAEAFTNVKRKRFFILRVAFLFFLIGIVGALLIHKKYEAHCVVVPQTSGGLKIGGNLGGLAALAGIDIKGGTTSTTLPISIYPNVFNNVHFRQELLQTRLTLSKFSGNATLEEYTRSPKYKHFVWWKRFKAKTINYYTVKQRKKRIKELNEMMARTNESAMGGDSIGNANKLPDFVAINALDLGSINAIDNIVKLNVDEKSNKVTIFAQMPEPIAAAQVASAVEELLQKYIIKFKTQKAEEFLNFIQARYDEAETTYQEKRDRLARFQDNNTTLRSAVAQARVTRLEEESLAAFDVYVSVGQQLEQAKISVKEDTPVFMIIEPVVNPVEPIGLSRAMVVLLCLVLGAGIAIFIIIFKQPILEILPNEKLIAWYDKEDVPLVKIIKLRKKA